MSGDRILVAATHDGTEGLWLIDVASNTVRLLNGGEYIYVAFSSDQTMALAASDHDITQIHI